MHIIQALDWAYQKLLAVENNEARLDAELLLAYCLDKPRIWLKTWPDKELAEDQWQHYQKLVARRLKAEPVAYIVGEKEFWSLNLKVTEDTLIPRPETEALVELALTKIPKDMDFRIADLGTGSGAIALAIASERPQATVFAVDFSEKALAVAEQNRIHYRLDKVQTVACCWLQNWSFGKLDLIVSNPPYVAATDPHLQDLTFEPYSALVANDQGYADIASITQQARKYLNPGAYLMFEHGYEQAPKVREILAEFGYQKIESFRDLAGHERVTVGCWC